MRWRARRADLGARRCAHDRARPGRFRLNMDLACGARSAPRSGAPTPSACTTRPSASSAPPHVRTRRRVSPPRLSSPELDDRPARGGATRCRRRGVSRPRVPARASTAPPRPRSEAPPARSPSSPPPRSARARALPATVTALIALVALADLAANLLRPLARAPSRGRPRSADFYRRACPPRHETIIVARRRGQHLGHPPHQSRRHGKAVRTRLRARGVRVDGTPKRGVSSSRRRRTTPRDGLETAPSLDARFADPVAFATAVEELAAARPPRPFQPPLAAPIDDETLRSLETRGYVVLDGVVDAAAAAWAMDELSETLRGGGDGNGDESGAGASGMRDMSRAQADAGRSDLVTWLRWRGDGDGDGDAGTGTVTRLVGGDAWQRLSRYSGSVWSFRRRRNWRRTRWARDTSHTSITSKCRYVPHVRSGSRGDDSSSRRSVGATRSRRDVFSSRLRVRTVSPPGRRLRLFYPLPDAD